MNGENIGKAIAFAFFIPILAVVLGSMFIGAFAFLRWLWGVAL